MKYCKNCGNKLKEEYAFCNKCGAKVEKVEKKDEIKEEIVEEKKEKEVKNAEKKKEEKLVKEEVKVEEPKKEKIKQEEKVEFVPPVYIEPKKKSGKGFLYFLILLLLASTITFLVLWLTKPSESCKGNSNTAEYKDKKNDNPVTKPVEEDDDKFIGKWEQNVDYKMGNTTALSTYGMIELKKDGTFRSLFYDKEDMYNNREEYRGTYKVRGNRISFNFDTSDDGEYAFDELIVKNDKLCLDDECENYMVQSSYNNKIVIQVDDTTDASDVDYIDYDEYQEIINDEEDAIVVVVRDGCSWCKKYESVVEEIIDNYVTPVYYYEYNNKIDVTGTPTTIIIKDGKIVDKIEGYKEYSAVEKVLDNNDIY